MLLSTSLAWGFSPAHSSGGPPVEALAESVQRSFAEAFAPRLLFHQDEVYFPCSPLDEISPRSGSETSGQEGALWRAYARLGPAEKAAHAVLFYRVYPWREQGRGKVVVEYWMYYSFNDYRGRGGLFPFWFKCEHPNDLEHLFLVLEPLDEAAAELGPASDPGQYLVGKILCGAHEINNVRHFRKLTGPRGHVQFLVEKGSHAVCPDLDEDGKFTPGIDGDPHQKYSWGIRDRGLSWALWGSARSEARVGEHAVRFRSVRDEELASPGWAGSFTYRLSPESELSEHFLNQPEDSKAMADLSHGGAGWVKRLFGMPDGAKKRLWIPSLHENFGDPKRVEANPMADERGITVGYTRFIADATLAVGARYNLFTPRGYWPNVIVEGQAYITSGGSAYFSSEGSLVYPVDRVSNVFVGGGVLSKSWPFRKGQGYVVGGLEVCLGRIRIRGAYRSAGSVCSDHYEFRVSYKIR